MPKMSRTSIANVEDHGIVEDRHEEADGTTVAFLSFRGDVDATPLLKGLPDDRCQCPHWGYVFSGTVTFGFPDRVETIEAGEAFVVPAGHTMTAAAGTEYLSFSPADELRVVDEVIARNMRALAQGV